MPTRQCRRPCSRRGSGGSGLPPLRRRPLPSPSFTKRKLKTPASTTNPHSSPAPSTISRTSRQKRSIHPVHNPVNSIHVFLTPIRAKPQCWSSPDRQRSSTTRSPPRSACGGRSDTVATFDFPTSGLSCYLRHKPDHLVHCFCGPAFLITLWDSPHTGPGTLHQGIDHASNRIAMHLQ